MACTTTLSLDEIRRELDQLVTRRLIAPLSESDLERWNALTQMEVELIPLQPY